MKSTVTIFNIVLLGLFFNTYSFSQEVIWGKEYERNENNRVVAMKTIMERKIVGWDETGFYMYVIENQSNAFVSLFPTIEKYDYNLNQLYSEKLGLPQADGTFKPIDVLAKEDLVEFAVINNQPMAVLGLVDFKTDELTLSSISINKNSGKVGKTINPIFKIPGGRKAYDFGWNSKLSNDSTLLGLLSYTFVTKKDFPQIQYQVIDENSKRINGATFTINYDYSSIEFLDFSIDEKHNLHLLAKVAVDKKEIYKVFSFYLEDKKLTEVAINDGITFVNSIRIFSLDGSSPIICGFSGDKKVSEAKGFFTMQVGENSSVQPKLNYKEFDNALLSTILSEKKIAKKPVLDNLVIRGITKASKDSYYLLAEQYEPDVLIGDQLKTFFESIVVVNFDSYGKIKSWNGIYKKQERSVPNSARPGSSLGMQARFDAHNSYLDLIGLDLTPFFSISYFVKNAELNILYNDNVKNGTSTVLDELKTLELRDEREIVLIKLKASNASYTKEIMTFNDPEFSFRPKLSFYSNKIGLVVYNRSKKIYKFGRVAMK